MSSNIRRFKPSFQYNWINIRTNNIFIDNIKVTGRTFSDQTGRFVCPSVSGNNYVFIVYDYDSNSIHAVPIATRKKEHIVAAFQKIVKKLTHKGLKPQLYKLNNEISQLMTTYIENEQITGKTMTRTLCFDHITTATTPLPNL